MLHLALFFFFLVSTGNCQLTTLNSTECETEHNRVRASTFLVTPFENLPAISWDATLAQDALNWVSQCIDSNGDNVLDTECPNGTFCGYGENIITSTFLPQAENCSWIVSLWESESTFYDFINNTCSLGQCGCNKYLRMIWATTTKVGCAMNRCNFSGNPFDVVVCRYQDQGPFCPSNGTVTQPRPYVPQCDCSNLCNVSGCATPTLNNGTLNNTCNTTCSCVSGTCLVPPEPTPVTPTPTPTSTPTPTNSTPTPVTPTPTDPTPTPTNSTTPVTPTPTNSTTPVTPTPTSTPTPTPTSVNVSADCWSFAFKSCSACNSAPGCGYCKAPSDAYCAYTDVMGSQECARDGGQFTTNCAAVACQAQTSCSTCLSSPEGCVYCAISATTGLCMPGTPNSINNCKFGGGRVWDSCVVNYGFGNNDRNDDHNDDDDDD